jgi:hypothetical protein
MRAVDQLFVHKAADARVRDQTPPVTSNSSSITAYGMATNLELLNEALEADTAFDEIPVMYILRVGDKVV